MNNQFMFHLSNLNFEVPMNTNIFGKTYTLLLFKIITSFRKYCTFISSVFDF